MGRVKNLEIVLSGNRSVFQGGETVRGKLIIEVEKAFKVRWVRLTLHGMARVHWTDSRNTGARLGGYGMLYRENLSAEVEYVNKKIVLLGSETGEARETLNEGRHEHRFTFTLPQNAVATSFEGKYGNIRYWLKAELGKPWAFAYKSKKPLTVISPIDINKPEYMVPVEAALEKNIYCWSCITAPVSAEIRTDRRGYCPGESIAISALFNNGTRRNVIPHASLYQVQSFNADGKSRKRAIKLTTVSGVSIPPGEISYWDSQLLKIPPVSPSITNCRLIKVDYLVEISLQIPGACNVHADLPIVIGTVPCRRPRPRLTNLSSIIVHAPHSETPHLRPAGPPSYQDLDEELPYEAPPTYAECIGGPVNILDDEDDEAQVFGITSFVNMFPYVYEHPNYVPPPAYDNTAAHNVPFGSTAPDTDLDGIELSSCPATRQPEVEDDDELDSDLESHFPVTLCNARYLGLTQPDGNPRRPSDESITLSDFMTII